MTSIDDNKSLLDYLVEEFNFDNYYKFVNQKTDKNYPNYSKNYFEVLRNRTLDLISSNSFTFHHFHVRNIKRSNKIRQISALNIEDKFLDRLVYEYIMTKINIKFDLSIHLISIEIKNRLKNENTTFIRFDIKDFFPSIDQKLLLNFLSLYKDDNLFYLIKSFLDTPIDRNNNNLNGKSYLNNRTGIPLGSAISQALSNLYLFNFDKEIKSFSDLENDYYYRYTDDICYLTDKHENLEMLKTIVHKELKKLNLQLNFDKLEEGNNKNRLNYLGFTHHNEKIKISQKSANQLKRNFLSHYQKFMRISKKQFFFSTNSYEKQLFFKRLSVSVNCAIRGYSKNWILANSTSHNVYGLAKYLSICDDYSQIKNLDSWLKKLNKYYCYLICETLNWPKEYIELESILNWYFRYKKDWESTTNLAFSRFKENNLVSKVNYKNNNPLFYEEIFEYFPNRMEEAEEEYLQMVIEDQIDSIWVEDS